MSEFDRIIKKTKLLLLFMAILALASLSLSIFSAARQNFDKPKECKDLKFHWNCCKTHLSEIPNLESHKLQNMIIMDWSTFSLEQYPPYERFSQFHLVVNKELLKRGEMTIFTPEDLNEFYIKYKKRSKK